MNRLTKEEAELVAQVDILIRERIYKLLRTPVDLQGKILSDPVEVNINEQPEYLQADLKRLL